ncbi:MAG: archaeosortase/exosortase family protein [Bacteroidota bacterium]
MSKQHQLIRFLCIVGVLCGAWFISYEFFIKPHGWVDSQITHWVTVGVNLMLNITGYDSHYVVSPIPGNAYLYIAPYVKPVVRVGASCNGLELFALFMCFMIAYPGKISHKLLFISIGLIIIHIANLFRTYWLVLLAYYRSPYYELFHRYVLIFFIYGLVFGLWMLWANKYSKR